MDHLGAALAHLLTRDPIDIVGESFSAVTFRPSGQDLLDILTTMNQNAPAKLVPHTQEDQERLMQDTKGMGAFTGVYMRHWERGDLEFPGTISRPYETSLETELRGLRG